MAKTINVRQEGRGGFTLVELLVVITIIGILMGLLIPAVNAARETARKNQCAVQVKNLALAAMQHEGSKKQLPGYVQKFGLFAGGTVDPSDPGNYGGTVPRHVKVGTWAVALLPWLDAQATYEQWTEDRYPIISDGAGDLKDKGSAESGDNFHQLAAPNLAIFQCPSNPVAVGNIGKNSYISNNGICTSDPSTISGFTPALNFHDAMKPENGAFNSKYEIASIDAKFNGVRETGGNESGKRVTFDDFKDGQGNTMLFSENVQALPWHRAGFMTGTTLSTAAATDNDIVFNTRYAASASTGSGSHEEARYTNGIVWHYEDKDNAASTMTALWKHGVPAAVDAKHNINGGGTGPGQDIFNLQIGSSMTNARDLSRPSSAHVDGVNAGMADGGVRFITESIDYRVYQAYLTLRGKSSDVPWGEYVLSPDAL